MPGTLCMVHRINTVFVATLRSVLLFSLSFSHEDRVGSSRGEVDEVITLTANGMHACI